MKINNEKFKQAILNTLADKEMIKILDCTSYRTVSVNDIIKEANIPHTTAYRKINWMLQEGLLTVEKIHITPDGKKFSLFRSTLKSITVKYEQNKVVIEAEYNVNPQEKTAERFFSLNNEQ